MAQAGSFLSEPGTEDAHGKSEGARSPVLLHRNHLQVPVRPLPLQSLFTSHVLLDIIGVEMLSSLMQSLRAVSRCSTIVRQNHIDDEFKISYCVEGTTG